MDMQLWLKYIHQWMREWYSLVPGRLRFGYRKSCGPGNEARNGIDQEVVHINSTSYQYGLGKVQENLKQERFRKGCEQFGTVSGGC